MYCVLICVEQVEHFHSFGLALLVSGRVCECLGGGTGGRRGHQSGSGLWWLMLCVTAGGTCTFAAACNHKQYAVLSPPNGYPILEDSPNVAAVVLLSPIL